MHEIENEGWGNIRIQRNQGAAGGGRTSVGGKALPAMLLRGDGTFLLFLDRLRATQKDKEAIPHL